MCADTSSFTRTRFLSKDKYTECTRFLANVTGYPLTKERKRRSILHKRFREKRLIFANNKNSSADIIYEIVKSNSCSGCDFFRRYLRCMYTLNLIKFHSTTWTNAALYLLPSQTIRIIIFKTIWALSSSSSSSPSSITFVVHFHLDDGGGGCGWGETLGGGGEMLRRTDGI